jgi:selenocysteine lyase/cysteine desulfurase
VISLKNIQNIREQFPITKEKTFLNHAGVSPLPKPASEAIQTYLEKRALKGESDFNPDEARRLFARLVNAEPAEIALVPNTSMGLSIAANMLEYPSGSNMVTTDLEFPSVIYPWLTAKLKPKVEVRYVRNVDGELRQEDFKQSIDDQTVAVALSHVEYANGFRNNLKAIAETAHEHGAFLIVDACQSAGALAIDVKSEGIDFLATSSYKWLLGPYGAGFLYIQKDLIEKSEPVFVGWASVEHKVFEAIDLWDNRELRLLGNASRFETGSPSYLSYVGAAAALKLILEAGPEKIERRVTGLAGYLIERLKKEDFKVQTPEAIEHRSGIVNFLVDNPQKKAEKISQRGITVSARMNGIRVSPHFYNTEEEIEKLLSELKRL